VCGKGDGSVAGTSARALAVHCVARIRLPSNHPRRPQCSRFAAAAAPLWRLKSTVVMQPIFDRRARVARVALASLLLIAGCGDEKCITQTTQYTTSVNSLGFVGPTLGQPVARFDLTQDFVSHTPYRACAQGPLQDVGAIRASITSTASAPIAIEFEIQGVNTSGIPVWSSRGRVERLMPKETRELGWVATSATHLDAGAKVVLTEVTVLP